MHVCVSLHLCTRLQRLGFETFTEEVESVLKDHKQQQKVRMGVYASLLIVSHPYRRTGSGKSTRWSSVASRRRSCSPSKKHSSRRAAKSSARPSSDLPLFLPSPSLPLSRRQYARLDAGPSRSHSHSLHSVWDMDDRSLASCIMASANGALVCRIQVPATLRTPV